MLEGKQDLQEREHELPWGSRAREDGEGAAAAVMALLSTGDINQGAPSPH